MRRRIRTSMTGVMLLFVLASAMPAAGASAFASPAFRAQWQTAERTVPNFWGPLALATEGYQEAYQEAPGGQRLVQYFDKARMELANPTTGTVTNGLLTIELISGRRQLGNTTFVQYTPSDIPVAGDPDTRWPPYRALNTAIFPEKSPRDTRPIGRRYNPDGTFTELEGLAVDPGAVFGSYQQDPGGRFGHNIPARFWDYLRALPVPWQTTMGYPITEPFWAEVKLDDGPRVPVLIQAFERRVLTYAASGTRYNPAGIASPEMGNVGLHYFRWRYTLQPDGSLPVASPEDLLAAYYDAINRKDYAAAYALWATPPQPFAQFAAGYVDTVYVTLHTGYLQGGGPSGDLGRLPVVIFAQQRGGGLTLYSGCYAVTTGGSTAALQWRILSGNLQGGTIDREDEHAQIARLLARPCS